MEKEHLDLMLKSQPESPSLHFKLGLWYRSRGQIKEAASYIEKALQFARDKTSAGLQQGLFDEPQGWLEYGKMMRMEGHIREAEDSFLQCLKLGSYELESMVEWGAMMLDSGMSDADISNTLQRANLSTSYTLLTAHSLSLLGAYKEALNIYRSINLTNDMLHEHLIPYVSCLIHIGEYDKAASLIQQLLPEHHHVLLKIGHQRILASQVIYVCKWCLNNGQGLPRLSCFEMLETAKTAIALGKVEEALAMVPSPTSQEHNEIIHTLYQHGYYDSASSMLAELQGLPLYDRNQTSLDLCFIAAEIHYDYGEYQKAASIFEIIFNTEPTHTPSRFAAASCHLQQSIGSFTEKQERRIVGSDEYFMIQQNLDNMTRAFQILQATNWHTQWTPAQKRNLSTSLSTLFH